MIKEREREGNRWTANAKEGGFVSEGPALGAEEKKKRWGGGGGDAANMMLLS